MVSLIIVANGASQRFGENKMLIKIENDFLINKTIKCFEQIKEIKEIILVSNEEIFNRVKNKKTLFVNGGLTRTESVKKGLEKVSQDFVLIHDGARPYVSKKIIDSIISNLKENDCVVPVLKVTNCLKKITNNKVETVNRDNYVQSQTPQGFKTAIIKKALKNNFSDFYDDCQIIENMEYKIKFIEGDEKNKKITFINDL
ncbi:IspD/TarI family cytidylyltransferase [Spiroplasma floricola]|uniref:2-C-methyl-D-erythritol 4-phosphate cytidylyltransferase n=1 Tax=Spiroplasma floricola 23-6 TaxID=1336749 RepID=A0A2K8SCA2_9MOLU|nr:IspD/TarI family cytidylyltransferase [Spiroplasma floricola]AUB31083.1 2-C-methyl-D-erythritol 4-phosphate cytidylyltransferase [Spiroplasma floricola 23-6]